MKENLKTNLLQCLFVNNILNIITINAMLTSTDNPENNQKLILRDRLAIERTKLANERTLFSYIRTSLYLLTAGIGVLQIKSISRLDGLAWVCIVSGILLFFFGFVRFGQFRKRLKECTTSQENTKES